MLNWLYDENISKLDYDLVKVIVKLISGKIYRNQCDRKI